MILPGVILGIVAMSPEHGWWEFLDDYPRGRREFEMRHPDLRTIRLLALSLPFVFLVLAALTFLIESPPARGAAEGFPTAFVVFLLGLAILLGGLVAYGIVRWHEDRAVGQIALAVGWGGPTVAFVALAQCTWDRATCLSIPAALILGILWLAIWLFVGLLVDYRLWTRVGDARREPDPTPPELP